MNKMTIFSLAIVSILLSLIMVSAGYTASDGKEELVVSAAISLKNVLESAGKAFDSGNAAHKITFNFGASGDLRRQIEGGAPVDIFISASKADMDIAVQKGLVDTASRADIARNSLVLIVPADSKLTAAGAAPFAALIDQSVKKIAVGSPATVPAGAYAQEALVHYGVYDKIKDKLVFCENVRQVLDYTARGEVDAALVYSTDAAVMAKAVRVLATASEKAHAPVVYPAAALKTSGHSKAAQAFIDFLVSEKGRKIFISYGFK
ncbi:MAG: molybdate ABC transporter substrate-binding protein [Nitrospirae bacterium]|nr:molybdate ABC transporter substrate-binding protein [Nitrospirota bacterium]